MENNKSTQKAGMEKQQRTTADTVGMSLNNNMMKGKGEQGEMDKQREGGECIQGKKN
jgi:hypothetical protein